MSLTSIGQYQIIAKLGEGGMGAVYRAKDPRLGREVAVKVLRDDVAGDADRRQRFVQEAKAVSALNHPNIVTVHDIGTDGDVLFMVMELVGGRSLAEIIPATGMSVAEVVRIGAQVADACAAAHARQIVHRDLKPANLMIQPDGRVKVLDFGLAKIVAASEASQSVTQTAAGMVVGTAAYMSPEQAQGQPLDARTDIFSLGAVLYEMTTGRRPFGGESTASVLAGVLKDDPKPPEEIRPDTPADLARVIMRCLRKDPERRVQTMADLRAALDDLKDDLHSGKLKAAGSAALSTGAVAAAPRGSRVPWVLAAGALAVAAGVIALYFWQPRSTNDADAGLMQPVPLTTYEGSERAGGFSPDGNQVVFAWDGESQNNSDIYVKLIGPGTPVRLTTDPAVDHSPRWSPDGRQIAFLRTLAPGRMLLILIPALGGSERVIGEYYPRVAITAYVDLDWAADSKHLFLAAGLKTGEPSNVQLIDIEAGTLKTAIPTGPASNGVYSLDVSPDGRRLAIVRDVNGSEVIELYDLGPDLEPRNMQRLTDLATDGIDVRWTADSRELLFRPTVNNPLPLYRMNPEKHSVTPMFWLGPGASSPIISAAAGRLVYTRDVRDTNIWRVTLGSSPAAMERIAVSLFREVAPQYSPDGKRLAFHSNRGGSVQIWVSDIDGSKAVQLTSMDPMATTGSPRWSPDGKFLVFDSNSGGGYHIYVVPADGGQPRALTTGPTRNFTAWYTPDSRWIYFSSDRTGTLEIFRIAPSGGEPEQITKSGAVSAPAISPDGQWLYYVKDEGVNGLWRQPIAGGAATRIVDGLVRYNFAVTNSGVYYAARQAQPNGPTTIRYLDLVTHQTKDIAPVDGRIDLGVALSPDGRYLLFTKIDYIGADLMLVDKFK